MNYNQFTRKQRHNLQLAKTARQLSRLTAPGLKQLKAAVFSWAHADGHWWLIFKVYSTVNISVAFKSSCCVIYSRTCSCVKVIIAQRLIQTVQIILTAMQKKALKSKSSSLQEWQKDVQYAKYSEHTIKWNPTALDMSKYRGVWHCKHGISFMAPGTSVQKCNENYTVYNLNIRK